MESQKSPAQRVCWGEEEQWNEQVSACLGGNKGYGTCADKNQEKDQKLFLPAEPTNPRGTPAVLPAHEEKRAKGTSETLRSWCGGPLRDKVRQRI